jgi:hypothetical protein
VQYNVCLNEKASKNTYAALTEDYIANYILKGGKYSYISQKIEKTKQYLCLSPFSIAKTDYLRVSYL